MADLDADENSKVGLIALKSELWAYYRDVRKDQQWQKLHSEVLHYLPRGVGFKGKFKPTLEKYNTHRQGGQTIHIKL
jgi:hypothetical protein